MRTTVLALLLALDLIAACSSSGSSIEPPADAGHPSPADASTADATTDAGPAIDAADANAAFDAASCTLSNDVQPIFTKTCATMGCHVAPEAGEDLVLTPGAAYAALVGVPAREVPSTSLVTPGDLGASYLYAKITGHAAPGSAPMPTPTSGLTITPAQVATIACWIAVGAPND